MKKKLRGVKRTAIQLDFDLYRVRVPIPDIADAYLSVLDLWPEGAEQTIMFVHGYAGVLESWEHQINHFAHNYRVIAPDLRGHGQSDAPFTNYTMDEMVVDIHAIVEHLNLPKKFILVAHSFGGSIAVEYANAHPERLEKLVLLATAGEYPLPKFANVVLKLPLDWLRPLWKYRNRWDAELHVVKRMMANNMRKWQGWNLMRNITTPTLVMTGERDNYFPRRVFEDVGKMIPNAEIYDVGSAKHKVQLERHHAVNRAIERFVSGDSQQSWRMQASQDDPLQSRVWLKHYSKETPPTVPIPKRPLHSFLESTANWLPKRIAIQFYGSKLTYQQFNKRVNQFANVLHGQGVRPGDRVMIVLPNMPQLPIAFYAILKIGGVAVMPNPDAGIKQIVAQARQTEPKVLIVLQGFTHLTKALSADASVPQIIFANIEEAVSKRAYQQIASRWGIVESESENSDSIQKLGKQMLELIQDAPTEAPKIDVKSSDLAIIIFTSGTIEEPKGVCLTHANLVANALQTRHWFPDMQYGKETFLSVLPLIHSYGLTNCMNLPIAIGATMVLLPVFDVQEVLENIKEHEVTIFPGVPSMYTAINQVPGVREYGLSSIKGCLSGAAPLPVEVQEAFEKLTHGRLIEGYGLTEASPVTHANPLYGVRKPGSIGVPLPNTEAKIVDMITGEDLPIGQIGELLVKGPQIMKGYWLGEGQFDTETIKDGWLDTGDVVVQDSDGYFQIINRKKDTIIFGEYNVYPRDVEEVIYENNKVLEVAVVGVGFADGEQKVKAFVVPRPGTDLTEEELLALCQRRLEPYAVPWEIEFRESLPKSFIGKVLRRML